MRKMALIPFRPWWARPFEEMERMFEEEFSKFPKFEEKGVFAPEMDVYETDKDVVAEVSLPGVEPEKVDVSVEDNTLTVKGSTEKKVEVKKKGYYRKEISSGSFYRSMTLPVPVVKEKAKAEFKNGILTITLPKAKPEKKGKKIEIKVK